MKILKRIMPYSLLMVVFIIVIFSFRSNPFSNFLNGHDSSMFLYFGKGMTKGLVPYKDMLDHKGPLLFIIQYFGNLLGNGNDTLGIWLIECSFLLITLIFLYKSCLLYTEDSFVSITSVSFLLPLFILCYDGGNYSEEFALLFISISFFLFNKIIINKQASNIEYVVIGFLGAATFFIRVNMISLWVVFCLYLIFLNCKDKSSKELFQQIKYIFLGGVLLTILISILSLIQNNFKEMLQQAFLMNLLYSSSNINEKIHTAFSFVELLIKTGVFPLLMIYLISTFEKKSNISTRTHIVLILYFIFNFYTVIVSGRYYTHYLITQLAPIVAMISISIKFITISFKNKYHKIGALGLLMLIILPSTFSAIKDYDYRFLTERTSEDQELIEVAKYINKNTSESDRIYVHNINANIYLLSNRFSNSKFFVLPSVNYDNFPLLKKDFSDNLTKKEPKYIVVRKNFFNESKISSNLNSIVAKNINDKYHKIKLNKDNYYLVYQNNKP